MSTSFFPVGEAVLVELPLAVAAYGFSNPTLRGLVLPQDVEPHVRNEDDKQRAPDRVDNGVSKGYEARYGQGYGRDVRPQRACRNRKAGLPLHVQQADYDDREEHGHGEAPGQGGDEDPCPAGEVRADPRDYEQEQACQNRTVVEVHDVADPAVNGY